MISDAGCVKLVDFGAASWELAARGSPRPPPPRDLAYAAPEVALGVHLERASDVYSLGAVLRDLCAGPLPDGLGAVIDRALRHAANERFATAADLAEALDDVAAHHRWRTRPALIGESVAQTFAIKSRSRRPHRRAPSESGITRVRLRRLGN